MEYRVELWYNIDITRELWEKMGLKTGSAESTLDDKGRVTIPVRFREYYQGGLVIAWGTERCALVMTAAEWERYEQDLRERSLKKLNFEQWEKLENKMINQAQDAELDKAGRIAIPLTLRKYANLTRDCVVINGKNRLSIWDSGVFEAYLAENDAVTRDSMNKLYSPNISPES